jgi:predicted small metal-binding protein
MSRMGVFCRTCGARLEADSKEELAKLMQEHAKEAHDMDMSDEEARKIIEGQIGSVWGPHQHGGNQEGTVSWATSSSVPLYEASGSAAPGNWQSYRLRLPSSGTKSRRSLARRLVSGLQVRVLCCSQAPKSDPLNAC